MKHADWLFRTSKAGAVRWLRSERHARRQNEALTYVPNGIVYVLTRARLGKPWWERAVIYPVPAARALDIDDERDLWTARALAAPVARSTVAKRAR
jgi:CMP-N-acetylneuraminic acid synthetase